MAHDTTLHIKIDPATNKQLSRLAEARKTSKGQLVRQAISACYSLAADELPTQQRRAVAAYEGGFISIGKLADAFGMQVIEMRRWLSEHGIEQRTASSADDHLHA